MYVLTLNIPGASLDGPIRTLHERAAHGIEQHRSVRIIDAVTTSSSGNRFGQLEGGRLRVQGPLCAMRIGELSESQRKDNGMTFLWVAKVAKSGSTTFWDDSASEDAAELEEHFVLIVQTHFIPGGMAPDYCGLILRPTRLKRGQYQRAGVVLYKFIWSVTDLDTFLQNAKNPE